MGKAGIVKLSPNGRSQGGRLGTTISPVFRCPVAIYPCLRREVRPYFLPPAGKNSVTRGCGRPS